MRIAVNTVLMVFETSVSLKPRVRTRLLKHRPNIFTPEGNCVVYVAQHFVLFESLPCLTAVRDDTVHPVISSATLVVVVLIGMLVTAKRISRA